MFRERKYSTTDRLFYPQDSFFYFLTIFHFGIYFCDNPRVSGIADDKFHSNRYSYLAVRLPKVLHFLTASSLGENTNFHATTQYLFYRLEFFLSGCFFY